MDRLRSLRYLLAFYRVARESRYITGHHSRRRCVRAAWALSLWRVRER